MYARTFLSAKRLITTTRRGPCMSDIVTRVIRDASTGKVIDESIIDDTPDDILHRKLQVPRDIRVEVTVRKAQKMFEAKGADIAEIYSPPRIVQEATMERYGGMTLKPGWSLDLTRNDPTTGEPWDFSKSACRERAMALVKRSKPYMLIGSPPCTAFSILQNINKNRRPAEVIAKEIAAGRQHLQFTMRLYEEQATNGRYFLHEHPHTASSWALAEVIHVMAMPSVETTVCHMCCFGMESRDKEGVGLVKKPTRFMSNSIEVLKLLDRKCTNLGKPEREHHRHVPLVEGRARACQEYPKELCRTVCIGVANQKKQDQATTRSLSLLDAEEMKIVAESAYEDIDEGLSAFECPADALHEIEIVAEDDVSGGKA